MVSLASFCVFVVVESTLAFQFGQFLKQASFFNPFLSGTSNLGPRRGSDAAEIFPNSNLVFGPLDDVIMGGRSESNWMTNPDGTGLWSGFVTTAGGGGFAGTRCKLLTPPIDASSYTGIKLQVKNEKGFRFKFVVRDNSDWNGPAFTWTFDTLPKNAVTEVKLPFKQAVPTLFARTVPDRELNTNTITTVQFVYSKFEFDDALNPTFKEGPFSLQVDSISLY